jgi:hypothetical protein
VAGKFVEAEEFDSDWRASGLREQPREVILQIGRILEWFNQNDQERTGVERWFWECFRAELVLVQGNRLQSGDPRGLREFRVAKEVPFRGRTRVNHLVGELREMLHLSIEKKPEEKRQGHGLKNRGASRA